ncbi:MAG: alanine racemase [Succinivibrio sp.]|nr:alanine racemase [Succinivibrio sp.]
MKAVTAYIDTTALKNNVRQIRTKVPKAKLIAVVKANAYGHGLYPISSALTDEADAFAVSRISEALSLRTSGVTKPIVLLEGFYNDEDVEDISTYDLYTAVHDLEQVEAIERSNITKPIHVWLKIDVGMHRLGSHDPKEIQTIKERLERCPQVRKPLGLISHLSVADTPSEEQYNLEQIEFFYKIKESLNFTGTCCLANSAGIYRWPKSHTEWVRPGIIMYGISPFANLSGQDLGLTPVMTLKSSLIAIHKLKAGDKVGYGAAFVAREDTTLGIVAAGYGDGYPRTAPNGTPVLVNGRRVPTAGHVCMDMMFVDLGKDSQDKVGDEVVLWGKDLPVEQIAEACGTIPYELVCRIMPRVSVEFN